MSQSNRSHPHQRRGIPTKPPKIEHMKRTLIRIWRYMMVEKGRITLVLAMVLISSILSLLGPYLLGVTVDKIIAKVEVSTLVWMLVLLACVYVFQYGAVLLQQFFMIGVAQNTIYTMRNDLFEHFHKMGMSFFQTKQHGELMSRATNDMENISRTLNSSVIQFSTSILTLIGTLGMMIWLSPLLTIVTLVIVPILFYGMKWITSRTGVYFKEQQRHLGDMNGYIEESLTGHHIITLYSREAQVMEQFKHKNEAYRNASYWAQTYTGFIPKLLNLLNNLSFALIVGLGGLFALNGWISIGVIVTFTTYSRQFTRPLNDLANQFNVILSAVAGAERVFHIMDEPSETEDEKDVEHVTAIEGKVQFRNVSFAYEKEQPTLENIHFDVKPGETVALVGPTGAGKTTIISLLSRFYTPNEGEIYVDGKSLSSISRKSLRNNLGMVLQDSFLFEATIRENIRYGRLDATDEEVMEAAKKANAHRFIESLPEGYETMLQSDGQRISHGQRQLLSIARAMLADPQLLILDEATSSIDTITEVKINEALSTLMEGRTSFVIAHRLNTIQNADQIIVLDEGKIVEKGTHGTLLRQNGMYASFMQQQLSKA
ncbi:ABC transporter ATP-binding protein [Pontibacillus yanchengensis]|uniref:Multidrug ABC transporter ATP-binding protein n=1 Tax=Pontibacillus yanchengensis Y32 TaxID=1385514 RepID=A0A0A2TEU9_9BACI|nr:ABC transporter ATP-binding protein [Pontibacillus yanchengensis]KGP74094.1 multidrug ABC transporter ATP-binding protein [Pontibacillus yanchengensis Y32]